jgi:hypothetical protein
MGNNRTLLQTIIQGFAGDNYQLRGEKWVLLTSVDIPMFESSLFGLLRVFSPDCNQICKSM